MNNEPVNVVEEDEEELAVVTEQGMFGVLGIADPTQKKVD